MDLLRETAPLPAAKQHITVTFDAVCNAYRWCSGRESGLADTREQAWYMAIFPSANAVIRYHMSGRPACDVDDAVSTMLFQLWEHSQQLPNNSTNPVCYLLTFATWRARDYMRQVDRQQQRTVSIDGDIDDGYVLTQQAWAARVSAPPDTSRIEFQELIAYIPETDQLRTIAILLAHGYKQVEIAHLLHIPPSTLCRRIRQIRPLLETFLADSGCAARA